MNWQSKIDVIDKNGWQKTYPLEKSITYIGSHSRSDIVLEGERGLGVASLHAQLIAANNHRAGYQLVNLSDGDIPLGSAGEQMLAPRSAMGITDGDAFRLGDFTLVFHAGGGDSGRATGGSRYIGLDLSMSQTRLAPHQTLDGIVKVQNLGEQMGVQFELELMGLDPDCYDLEPGPLLSSGGEKEVFFRLYHRGTKPLAGDLQITIRATAPRTYPGEHAAVSQVIQVLPLYRHQLSLAKPGEVGRLPPVAEDFLTPKVKSGPLSQAQRPVSPPPMATSSEVEDLWGAPAEVRPVQGVERSTLRLEADEPPTKVGATPVADISAEAEDLWSTPPEWGTPPEAIPSPQTPPAPEREVSAEATELWAASSPPAPELAEDSGEGSIEAGSSPLSKEAQEAPVIVDEPSRAKKAPAPPAQQWEGITADVDVQPRDHDRLGPETDMGLPPQPSATETAETGTVTPSPLEVRPISEEGDPVQAQAEPGEAAATLSQPEEQLQEAEAKGPPTEAERPPQVADDTEKPPPAVSRQMPQAEPKAERWWSRLNQLLPFQGHESPDLPPDSGEAEVEVPTPPTETGVETPSGREGREALKFKPGPAQAETQTAGVETDLSSGVEDWWSTEAESDTPAETKKRQVLKLKASPVERDEQAVARDHDLPAEVEDWWSTETEDEQVGQVEKKGASESDQDTSS